MGASLLVSLTRLPSLEGTILFVVDLLLAVWVVQVWFSTHQGATEDQDLGKELAIGAGVVALAPLSHVYFTGVTTQATEVVIILLSLPFVAGTSLFVLPVLIGYVTLWGLLSFLGAPLGEAFATTFFILLAGSVSGGHWFWLRGRREEFLRAAEEQKRQEKRDFHERQRRAKVSEREEVAVEASCSGHWYWDLKAEEIQFSDSWAHMLGHQVAELGTDPEAWFSRVHSYYLPELKEALSAHLYGKTERFQSQYRIQHRDGTYLWVMNRGVALRDADGTPIAIAGSQIDITQLVDVEQSIVDEAYRDRLTGLANREAFLIRLEQAIGHVKKGELNLVAVMFLDLDRFKVINDSLGHLVGDQLLAAVSSRLRNCTRQARGDLVARFGGDEFVILLEDLTTADDALEVARRIVHTMEAPFRLGKHEVRTGVSIGIATGDLQIERAEDLLRNADTAMYQAKAEGRGRIAFFNSNMHAAAMRLNQLQNDLAKAIDRDELLLHYQPILSARSGKIVGAEALVRWRHSSGDMIGPGEFIPIAEEIGLIESIGEWVLRSVCFQAVEWQKAGLPPLKVSVNASPHQLRDESLPILVQSLLAESGLDASLLEFEVTETALMSNVELVARTIETLGGMGVGIALDDFGTGYSSLEHLRRFTFRTLKIDRSFVAGLTTDERAAAVARGLINLAHQLRLAVTAEGVETGQQLAFLKSHGCDKIQGYYASRPVEPAAFMELVRSDFDLYQTVAVTKAS